MRNRLVLLRHTCRSRGSTRTRSTFADVTPSSRVAAAFAALLLAGSVLAGCGGEDAEPTTMDDAPSSTAASLPPVTASPTPTPTPKPKPSKKPRPTRGSGDAEGDDEPAAEGGGVCVELSEDEIGAVLGGPVSGAALPGGGCAFNQARPRPPAANIIDVPYADMAGGMAGAEENAISSVEGEPEDVTGIGEAAFVVTGTSFGGSDVQGAGAVHVGDRLVMVNVVQSTGLKAPKVRELVLTLLKLVVSELG